MAQALIVPTAPKLESTKDSEEVRKSLLDLASKINEAILGTGRDIDSEALTPDQKAALAGTSGTPSATNPYVTKEDIEPMYLSNTESTINTNGVVSKTEYDINGTPIIANTAATYYDMTLLRTLLPGESMQIQVHSKIDGNWVQAEQALVPSLFCPLVVKAIVAGNLYCRGIVGVAKISSGVVRVYMDSVISAGASGFSGTSSTDRTWAQIIAAADGYDAWRVRIGK